MGKRAFAEQDDPDGKLSTHTLLIAFTSYIFKESQASKITAFEAILRPGLQSQPQARQEVWRKNSSRKKRIVMIFELSKLGLPKCTDKIANLSYIFRLIY